MTTTPDTPSSRPPPRGMFLEFFHSEVSGSVLLMISALAALVWANSPWSAQYFELAHTYVGISWGETVFKLSIQHWINDGLMAVFFFVIGLEVKREIVLGELASFDQAVLPVSAAIGGMLVPALGYVAAQYAAGGDPTAGLAGWGIPMATDIAFALGILSLFGSRAPLSLKVFLTALAIADDLGAILVIALFYTESIAWVALAVAAVFLLAIFVAARLGTRSLLTYSLLAFGGWAALLASGIHATIGGIVVAMLVPVTAKLSPPEFFERTGSLLAILRGSKLSRSSMVADNQQLRALDDLYLTVEKMRPAGIALEHLLHPLQVFLILPLFAFFNSGVSLHGDVLATAVNPISIGIVVGLVLGKPLGVLVFSWIAVRVGLARLPEGVSWSHLIGVGCLAGVGFTMSIFISDLAFTEPLTQAWSKIAILLASLLAGAAGYLVLRASLPRA